MRVSSSTARVFCSEFFVARGEIISCNRERRCSGSPPVPCCSKAVSARSSNNRADGGWRLFAVRRCRSYAWSRTGQCASSPRTIDFQVLDRDGRILIARPCFAEIGEISQEIGVASQRLVGCIGLSSLCWGRYGRRTVFCGSGRRLRGK